MIRIKKNITFSFHFYLVTDYISIVSSLTVLGFGDFPPLASEKQCFFSLRYCAKRSNNINIFFN